MMDFVSKMMDFTLRCMGALDMFARMPLNDLALNF